MRRGVAVVVGVLALALPACGGTERSVASYCDYFYGEGAELRERYLDVGEQAGSDPFAAMGALFAAPTELGKFFAGLAERAPDEIQADVEIMAEAFGGLAEDTKDNVANPMAGLARGLFGGMASAPAASRVDRYTLEECGPPPGSGD